MIEEREWILEALSTRCILRADRETTYSPKGTPNGWMLDTRLLLVDPEAMLRIAKLFWRQMENSDDFQLACLEMTGIPLLVGVQAHGLAIGRAVNGVIVRKERKVNGRMRAIEGELSELPVVFLDDIINSGASVEKANIVLQERGNCISKVWALVDYGNEKGRAKIEALGATITSEYALNELGKFARMRERKTIPNPFREVWRFGVRDERYYHVVPKSTPVIDDERLYFGTDSGLFFALRQADGEVCWQFDAKRSGSKGIWSSPIVTGEMVIFGAYNGNVYALDRRSGKISWQFQESDFVGSSPALAEEFGIVAIGLEHTLQYQKGSVVGLNRMTGDRVWEFPARNFVHSTPLYIPSHQIFVVGSNDNDCVCLDAKSGHLRWMFQTSGPVKSRAALGLIAGIVLFGCFDHCVYAVDIETGSLRWKVETEGIVYSEPLVIHDRVYVTSTDKQMYVLDLYSGNVLHRWDADSKLFSSPMQVGGKIYLGTNAGVLVEFDQIQTRC